MLSFAWHRAALAALEPDDTPHIVLLPGDSGSIRGIAPLVHRDGARYMTLLANDAVPEPAAAIAADPAALTALLRGVRRLAPAAVRLNRVPDEVLSADRFGAALSNGFLTITHAEGGSPWLPISGTWTDFERSLASQRRSDLRRARRKAEECGAIKFQILRTGDAAAQEELRRFTDLERLSWKRGAGTTIIHDSRAHRFFSALCSEFDSLVFGFMDIGGHTAAGLIALEYRGTLWVLKTAYDDRFRNCSPGILLMHEIIRHAFDSGYNAFEFLGFEEPWMRLWTKESRSYYSAMLYTYSPRGVTALCGEIWSKVREKLRRPQLMPAEA